MTYIDLPLNEVALAALLLLANGLISLVLGLGLEASLAVAAVRMVVQLGVVGVLLKLVFAHTSPLWTALAALAMLALAGGELLQRQEHRFRHWYAQGFSHLMLLLVGGLVMLYVIAVVIGPTPWYAPRYVLPLFGIVTGSTLSSASLALQTLTEGALRERGGIEARMALGANRFTAFRPLLRRAVRAALAPFISTMSVTGFLAMPGVMAGQILAGADPTDAAKFQIMVICMMAGAAGLGAVAAAVGGVLLLTDTRHRLRLDRLTRGAA